MQEQNILLSDMQMMDVPHAFTTVDTGHPNHDPRSYPVFSMPSMERNQEENPSYDDDSDVEVAPVPAAAYADPSVYRWIQRDDASDYDSTVEERGFIYDSEEDSSFDPDKAKSSDDDEVNSFCTDVGNEVEILNSPAGTTPFDPIDLTISMDSTEDLEPEFQETQALFSDASVEESSARRALPELFWGIREEQAFFDLRMEDLCAFTGRNIPYHGRRMTTDASRRAFNHLLREEETMRHEREQMI